MPVLKFEKTTNEKSSVSVGDILECPYCENKLDLSNTFFGSKYKIITCSNCLRKIKVVKVVTVTYFGCRQR